MPFLKSDKHINISHALASYQVNFIQCRDLHEALSACGCVFRCLFTCTSCNDSVNMSDYVVAQCRIAAHRNRRACGEKRSYLKVRQ